MISTLEVAGGVIAIFSILVTLNLSSFLLPPNLSDTRNILCTAEIINVTGAVGPESLAFDPNGEGPYTGVADGRILKLQEGEWFEFAVTSSNREKCKRSFAPELEHVCGRPLGLQFDLKTGDLYIADAYFGLLVVGPRGGLAAPVVTKAERQPLYFTNDMDIDGKEEVIYFTDTSTVFRRREKCKRSFAPELEHVCGRPLGLQFDLKTGDLYVADAYFGLLVVGPRGGLATPVVTKAEGKPLYFTNDMDMDGKEEVIYFTDTSTVFRRRDFIKSIFSGDKTGRLIKYDKSTKQTSVLIKGLAFANGVALSEDRSFLLVAETITCRILRYWLRGPNAGNLETFAELPGYPDNIRRNSEGEFWVGLHAKRGPVMSWVLSKPWVGKLLLLFPFRFKQLHVLVVGSKPHAIAVKLSEEGKVLEVLEDDQGKRLRFISEVEERDGKLWMASVLMPFIGILKLD